MWGSKTFWRFVLEVLLCFVVVLFIGIPLSNLMTPTWAVINVIVFVIGSALWLSYRATGPLSRLAAGAKALVNTRSSFSRALSGDDVGTLESALSSLSQAQVRLVTQIERDREQLQAVLRCMAEGVLVLDGQEKVVFYNEAARQILKLTDSVVLGKKIWELIRHRGFAELAEKSLLSEEPVREEFALKFPEEKQVLVQGAALIGAPDRGAVLVLQDKTHERRLERTRQEFFADVSHELKTPVATIKAMVETLLDGAMDDPKHNVKFLTRIAEGSHRLDRLVGDLLIINRIETGQKPLELTRFSLNKVLQNCIDRHVTLAKERSQTLQLEAMPEELFLYADEMAVDQILDNLVDNAIKYTPTNGSITLRGKAEGNLLKVEVSDSGIGLDRADVTRIFERFYRVDKARSLEAGGSGLGLSIVKHLVQQQQGRIEVESQPGQGSTFRVWLPRVD